MQLFNLAMQQNAESSANIVEEAKRDRSSMNLDFLTYSITYRKFFSTEATILSSLISSLRVYLANIMSRKLSLLPA